jgi:hypothetical protein
MTIWPPSFAPVETYDPLSIGQALLLYAGIPLLIILTVVLLVSAPSWTRQGRHRPGMGWDADPLTISSDNSAVAPALPAGDGPDAYRDSGGGSGRW